MHDIEMQEASPEFQKCWQAAGLHLEKQVQGGLNTWLRAHITPPFLEHLSFRLGNQLFFVRLVDSDGRLVVPGSVKGLMSIANGCKGHACLMPMKKSLLGSRWSSAVPGWGLIDAQSKAPLNPILLVSDEKIEMTDWELHDFAVQVVRGQLEKEGCELMSWQGNPGVDPAVWFVGKSKRPEWVVVRAVRYPETTAQRPSNWADIAAGCARIGDTGHFASVAFVSEGQPFKEDGEPPVPLWRGHGVDVRYSGLDA